MKKCIIILVLSLVLTVSVALVSILSCPMVMAAPPSMPNDVQMVQPDPSLPKELAAFLGKWEGATGWSKFFLIVEKIDEGNATLYWWRSNSIRTFDGMYITEGWERVKADIVKWRGKYKLSYPVGQGNTELTLKGEYINTSFNFETYPAMALGTLRLTRVP
jgi:hypothetical protein